MLGHRTIAGHSPPEPGVGSRTSTAACGVSADESANASRVSADLQATCHSQTPTGHADRDTLTIVLHDLLHKAQLGLPSEFDLRGPISVRPQSAVYRLDHSDGAHSLAVKQYIDPRLDALDTEAAVQQFGDLTRSFAAMKGDPFFRIPEPIFLFENEAIMLMEWVEGRSLLDAMRRRWPFAPSLTRLCRTAGAWLRAFHEAGSEHVPACGADEPGQQMERVRVDIERKGIALATTNHGLQTLAEYLPVLRSRSVLRSWLHGDFQPDNVIFTSKAVYGIDVIHSTHGIALADVAHFLNHVQRLAFQPSGLHLILSHRRMLKAFMSGYAGLRNIVDPLVLAWYRLLDDLRFLCRYYDDAKNAVHQWHFVRLQTAAISQHMAMLRNPALQAAQES